MDAEGQPTDHATRPVGPDDPSADPFSPEGAARGIAVMVRLMTTILEDRLTTIAAKLDGVLHQRIDSVRQESAGVQDQWATQEIDLLRGELRGLNNQLADELSSQLGPQIVTDYRTQIDDQIEAVAQRILERAGETIEKELPTVAAYRVGRDAVDAILSQPEERPVRDWVTHLHGGQLAMVISFAIAASLALSLAGVFVWMGVGRVDVEWLLFGGSALCAGLAVWTLWVWLGSRATQRRLGS